MSDGSKVGEHDGAWFFTIGQSRGLDINIKAYVTAIDVHKNTITVSYERNDSALLTDTVKLANWHRLADSYDMPADVQVKIRYRQNPLAQATLKSLTAKNVMTMVFDEEQRGIAPGQSIVAYDGDVCI